METAQFKALKLDKAILRDRRKGRSCNSDEKGNNVARAHRIHPAPFNLKTDTRGRERMKKGEPEASKAATFKARPMPTYKVFEPTKAQSTRGLEFQEFNLRTLQRQESRTQKSIPADSQQQYTFKATKMPDFRDTFNGVRPQSPKKLTTFEPFNLSTHNRGAEKQEQLQVMIEAE